MKKILILLFIAVTTLTLCACSNQNTAITKNDAASYTNAPEADFKKIHQECSENIVAAENQYVGNPYQFSGWVYDVDESTLTIVPIQFPKYADYGSWYTVKINMPEEELLKVKTREVITVGGIFSELKETSATMSDGVYIDNVIPFEGKVSGFVLDYDTDYYLMQINHNISDITYYYPIEKADSLKVIEEATINGVTFKKDDWVRGTATLTQKDSYVGIYNITEIVSIEN